LTCSKCRRKGHVRLDVLQRRLTTHCPYCTAAKHLTELS
jgi:DNA-directed RNA polymerase subunit RPC12/RpoP